MKLTKIMCYLMLTLLLTLTFAFSVNACTDSDNGINLEARGVTTGPYGQQGVLTMTDYCIAIGPHAGYVNEYYCEQGIIQYDAYECPYGWDCVNGKCRGSDSVLFDLHYGEAIKDILPELDSHYLPALLHDETYITNEGNTYAFEQEIDFGDINTIPLLFTQDDLDFPQADSTLFLDNSYLMYEYGVTFRPAVEFHPRIPGVSLIGTDLLIMEDSYEITAVTSTQGELDSITLDGPVGTIEIINNQEVVVNGIPLTNSRGDIRSDFGEWNSLELSWSPDDEVYLVPGDEYIIPPFETFKLDFASLETGTIESIEFVTGSGDGVMYFVNNDGAEVGLPLAADEDSPGYDAVQLDNEPVYWGADAPEVGDPREDELMYLDEEACLGSNNDVTNCQGAYFLVVSDDQNAELLQISNIDTTDDEIDFRSYTYEYEQFDLEYVDGSPTLFLLSSGTVITLTIDEATSQIKFNDIGSVDGAEILTETSAIITLVNQDTDSQISEGIYFTERIDPEQTRYLRNFEITAVYDDLTDDSIELDHTPISANEGYGWFDEDVNSDYIKFMTWKGTEITYDEADQQSLVIQHSENPVTAQVYVSAT